jgi:hypothetical protein
MTVRIESIRPVREGETYLALTLSCHHTAVIGLRKISPGMEINCRECDEFGGQRQRQEDMDAQWRDIQEYRYQSAIRRF